MYKMILTLDNLQWLKCHKNQTKSNCFRWSWRFFKHNPYLSSRPGIFHFSSFLSVVDDRCRGRPESYIFNSDYTAVQRRELLLSLDFSTLLLIRTLYCWVVSKEVSSTIFKVFGMTLPGIETRSPGPLANTLPTFLLSIKWFQLF